MQDTVSFFPEDLYLLQLSRIRGISFTHREVDVMACLLGARKTSKIAYFLSVDPRTIETHVRNITLKIESNTREGIIDFLELSDKVPFLRKHYVYLQIESVFKKSLKDISKILQEKRRICILGNKKEEQGSSPSLASLLAAHLKFAGFEVTHEPATYENGYLIYILPVDLQEIPSSFIAILNRYPKDKTLLLFTMEKGDQKLPKELKGFKTLSTTKYANFYFYILDILKTFFPISKINPIISDFKEKYGKVSNPAQLGHSRLLSSQIKEEKSFFLTQLLPIVSSRKWFTATALVIICCISIGFLSFYWQAGYGSQQHPIAQSELSLPTKSVFLERPELLLEIEKGFNKTGDIQTVALVGIGGSGKTTLARQYAQQQKAKIVWEINAETKESVIRSIINLAYSLAQTKEDSQHLQRLEQIKNSTVKDNQFVEFIKNKMKASPRWFLIYDNIEDIACIEPYFPRDAWSWGSGRILITTRDSHIENNNHINEVIQIPEMNQEEKLTLFTNIMNKGKKIYVTTLQKEQTQKLLEAIPSFPLDVSMAAYYLRATGTNCEQYLGYLNSYRKDFIEAQSHIIKNMNDYTKTRYGIVYVSLSRILKTNEKFKDLLLLISLLDFQHIPRSLLEHYAQDPVLVDNFIFHLKKYSLIIDEIPSSFYQTSTLFMHPSTQQIILSHLDRELSLKQNDLLLSPIIQTMESLIDEAMDQENIRKMRLLTNHCKKLLSRAHFLTDQMIEALNSHLGRVYYYFGDYLKAKVLFENNLTLLNRNKDSLKIAHTLLHLGNINRKLGQYKEAKEFLEASLTTFNQHLPNSHTKIAEAKVYLGAVYRNLGDYEKAKNLLHESYLIYQQNPLENPSRMAMTLARLGNVYRNLGKYDKAQAFMEKSLQIYQDHFPEDQVRRARVLSFLAVVYRERGDYKKSKNLLEESLLIYRQNALDHHADVAWSLCILATIYKALGDYSRAINLLEQGIHIYKVFYPENQVDISWVLSHLGVAYKDMGHHKKAQDCTEKALAYHQVFFGNHNIRTSWALINAATVYKRLGYYEKAKDILEKSLIPYENHYGNEHIILARILRDLGDIHLLLGNMEVSEDFLKKALHIFNRNTHPEKYTCLESLSYLCMKKSLLQEKSKKYTKNAVECKTQAITYLKQALDILSAHFPANSPHRTRIQDKLKKLEQS